MIRTFFCVKAIHCCTNATARMQKRSINQCLHIKGIPTVLSRDEIYTFMKDYGSIQEMASYEEAPQFQSNYADENADFVKHRNFITHNRPPGQTAIVRFHDIKSALMCKEDLHWRPFPTENYELTNQLIYTYPRDRPLVNILFETQELFERLRPWVRRDLYNSRIWISKLEGRPVEEGPDRGRTVNKRKFIPRRTHNESF